MAVNLEQAKEIAQFSDDGQLILNLVAELESERRMSDVNKSFYDLTVKERDLARLQATRLGEELSELKSNVLGIVTDNLNSR